MCCDSSICKNSSDQLGLNEQSLGDRLSSQDDELLRILGDLQNKKSVNNDTKCSHDTRISGYFCSDTVFNLNQRVLSEDEIKVLEKGLDFAPIHNKVNEPELKKDFYELCLRMRIKCILGISLQKILVPYQHLDLSYLGNHLQPILTWRFS